jgi:hypothetical protein
MKIKLLDTVVLQKDLPGYGVQAGDMGAVVEIYEPNGIEVEFVTGSGKTQALVTLRIEDVRLICETDILS